MSTSDARPVVNAPVGTRLGTAAPLSSAALTQQRLWGSDPQAWADHSEPHNRPLFEAVLAAAAAGLAGGRPDGPGDLDRCRLLDVGCGTGLLLNLAAERGATVHGIDVVAGMLALAAVAEPSAELRQADLQHLPFDDASMDAITAVNALQFAENPVAAVADAARVLVPGGVLVASFFAAPELSQTTVVHEAMSALSPPQRAGDHAPYALAAPGNYEAALAAARLHELDRGDVTCWWTYPDVATAVHGLLASAGGTRAVADAGRPRAAAAVAGALGPYVAAGGTVSMRAVFRWVSARRPIG